MPNFQQCPLQAISDKWSVNSLQDYHVHKDEPMYSRIVQPYPWKPFAQENNEAKESKKKRVREKKASQKGDEKEKKESRSKDKKLLSTPLASSTERPVRERKTVERLVEALEKEPVKKFLIEKVLFPCWFLFQVILLFIMIVLYILILWTLWFSGSWNSSKRNTRWYVLTAAIYILPINKVCKPKLFPVS